MLGQVRGCEAKEWTYAGLAMSARVGMVEKLEDAVMTRVGEVCGCGKTGGAGRCIRGKIHRFLGGQRTQWVSLES